MASVALVAESMSHHPEWSNVYNKVVFDLWTHTHNGISNLDVDLGKKIEELAQSAQAR
jgi:4a-hydroxytetrahydrobiopterin dehydratase